MARNPKKQAKKTASKPRKAKHGGKVVTRADIADAGNVPETIKLPAASFIKDFVTKTLAGLETEKNSAVGDIGAAISNAAEKKNVEKRALSIARRLHKMPDKKFQETWFHFLHYAMALGFQERADKQGQLDLDRAAAAAEAEDAEEQATEETTDEAPGTDGTKSPGLRIVDPPAEEAAA